MRLLPDTRIPIGEPLRLFTANAHLATYTKLVITV